MAGIYSIRMAGGPITTTGGVQVAVVPAGTTWIVRDISITNVAPTDMAQVLVYVLLPAGNADIFRVPGIPAHGFVQWQGRQVLNQGEELWLYQTESTSRLMVSGYQLANV